MNKKLLIAPYGVWIVLFTVIPLAMILAYGLTSKSSDKIAFSLDNLIKALQPIYMEALARSIGYASLATLICLVLAYPLAMILATSGDNSRTIIFIFILPMWMNFLLRTYAWLSILESNTGILNVILRFLHLPEQHLINTPGAIVLGMVYNFLPFMILPIYNALIKIDTSLLEAAADLGANNVKRFIRVMFPLSLPGVMSGISMVFMPAVTTFVIPNLLGGGKINLIGNLIEQQFLQSYNWYFGASLSIVLMVVILLSMAVFSRFDEAEEEVVSFW